MKNGFVHGCGTVDQKGGVASFITARRIIKELALYNNLTIYFVGSAMEEDSNGLSWKCIVGEVGIKPDFVTTIEPTKLAIYREQRGRMEMEVSFRGVCSHGSEPGHGKNVIYMAS